MATLLLHNEPIQSTGRKALWDDPIKSFLLFVVVPSIVLIGIVNLIGREPNPQTIQEKLALVEALHNTSPSKEIYLSLIKTDSTNLEYHRGYIQSHYQIPHSERTGGVLERYKNYTRSANDSIRDIGFYGLGFCAYHEKDYPEALRNFALVKNRHLRFLNNNIGLCLLDLGDYQRSETALRDELDLDGYTKGAVANLSRLYFITHQDAKLKGLVTDHRYEPVVTAYTRGYVYLRQGNALGFIKEVAFSYLGASFWDKIICLANFAIWFGYFILLNFVMKRRILWLLGAFTLAIAVSIIFYSVLNGATFLLNMGQKIDLKGNLLTSIFGIGLVEESIKLLPVLLLLRFSRQIKSPLDLLIAGCMSALGFAFLEGLQYAGRLAPAQNVGYAVNDTIMHMSYTSVALYGLWRSRFLGKGKLRLSFSLSFGAACVLHGLYDFLLGSSVAETSVVMTILMVAAFGLMLNQAIVNSPSFQQGHEGRLRAMGRGLGIGLSGIVMAQYSVTALRFGPANANYVLPWYVLPLFVNILIVSSMLGYFHDKRLEKQYQDQP